MDYSLLWDLSTIPDEALKAERGRRNAARVLPENRKGGIHPTCECGTCRKCKKREAVRRYRAKTP